jgi:hypothetical protein
MILTIFIFHRTIYFLSRPDNQSRLENHWTVAIKTKGIVTSTKSHTRNSSVQPQRQRQRQQLRHPRQCHLVQKNKNKLFHLSISTNLFTKVIYNLIIIDHLHYILYNGFACQCRRIWAKNSNFDDFFLIFAFRNFI